MSQWARSHPEEMAEIAGLPPSRQNAELRHAVGYDPDRIRDEHKERVRYCYRPSEHDRAVLQQALDENDLEAIRVLLAIDSVRGER